MGEFKFGKSSLKELEGVHPSIVQVAHSALEVSTIDFTIFDGLRTQKEQDANLAAGTSTVSFSKHQVQPASGYGEAIDAVPIIGGKPRWVWPGCYKIACAVRLAAIKHNVPITWGAVWDRDIRTLPDTPEGMEKAHEEYVARRKALGKKAFSDGPHYELRPIGSK